MAKGAKIVSKIRDIPLGSYPTGVYTFEHATPNGLRGFSIAVGRKTDATPTYWPNTATQLTMKVEGSFDNGAHWNGGSSISGPVAGGIRIDDDGSQQAETIMGADFWPVVNRIRVTFTVTSGPIYTYGDITVA